MSKAKPIDTQVYVREATGLVRELGAKDIFIWTIVWYPLFASYVNYFWYTPALVHNVNYYLAFGLWFILFCIFPPALWWMMISIMPKTGGDYVFTSRALHPAIGFSASFCVTFALALTAISGGTYYGLAETAVQSETAGQISGNQAVTAAGLLIDPFAGGSLPLIFALGVIVLVIGAAFAYFGSGVFNKVIWVIFGIGLVGLVIEVPILLMTSRSTFAAAYAQYYSGGVQGVFAAAQKGGYVPGYSMAATLLAVPVIAGSLGPYLVLGNVAGEVKNVKRSYLLGLWGAIVLSAVVWVVLTFLTDRVIGLDFIEAWTVGPGGGFPPVVSALLTVVAPNLTLNIAVALILLISNIGFSYLGFAFASRAMLAWAFDRVAPVRLAYVNEKYHSPGVAILVTLLISLSGWTLIEFTRFTSIVLNSDVLKYVAWGVVSLSAVIMPFRKKELFDRSPVKYRIAGVPVISILGLVSFFLYAYYIILFTTTNLFFSPSVTQVYFLAFMFVIAIAGYFVAYAYRKSKGIDITKAFEELPPD